MIHLFRYIPHRCQPALHSDARRRRNRRRLLLLLPLAGFVLASASCSESTPEPPPVPVTDTKPVGDGLKVIGYALVGCAVTIVLGSMIKN